MISKNILRQELLSKRSCITLEYMCYAGKQICEKALDLKSYENSHNIMCYMSIRNEVPTKLFIERCFKDKKTTVFPVCLSSQYMIAVKADSLSSITGKDFFGISGPDVIQKNGVDPKSIDLIIVPGVAFTVKGHRIGYGRGFFDRFLPNVRKDCVKVGFAYDFQVVTNDIQPDEFDIPVDIIISEKSIYYNENSSIQL